MVHQIEHFARKFHRPECRWAEVLVEDLIVAETPEVVLVDMVGMVTTMDPEIRVHHRITAARLLRAALTLDLLRT